MTISSWEPAIQSTGSGWARQAGQGTVARKDVTQAQPLLRLVWSSTWVKAPLGEVPRERAVNELAQCLADLNVWTGLSMRALAEILGTTHPTLSAVASGHTNLGRSLAVRKSLRNLHVVVARLRPAFSPDLLMEVLQDRDVRAKASDLLRSDDARGLYVLMHQRLAGEAADLPTVDTRLDVGLATVALDD